MFYLRIAILSLFTSLMLASCTKQQASSIPNTSALTDLYVDAANDEASSNAIGDWVSSRVLENDANISLGYSSTFVFAENGIFTVSTSSILEGSSQRSGTYEFQKGGKKLVLTYPETLNSIVYQVSNFTRDNLTLSTNMQGKHMMLDFTRD